MGAIMIVIKMYGEDYEQDIRPLIKAFFPRADFQIEKSDLIPLSNQTSPVSQETELFLGFSLKNDEFVVWVEKYEVRLERKHGFTQDQMTDGRVTRVIYRNELHRQTYQLLSDYTKQKLPWGTLTGIRPTKQVLERLEAGESEGKIREFMKSEYYCSNDKINLSLAVAKREHEILSNMDYHKGYSAYVGIPFCPSTCNYCSFTSYPLGKYEHLVEPYLKALTKEIEYASKCLDKRLSTIYIGCGTPTTLTAKQLDYLLDTLYRNFDMKDTIELTVEAGRPDSITREKLQVLKDRKVDRISINPQSMRQKTLDLIGRHHTAEQIEQAFYMARDLGHESINMDIILGLSG
jgi:oxygen-independent coproporphyrinogen-3 oxidase